MFTVTNPSDTPVRVRLQPIDVDRLLVLASGEAEGEGDQQNTAAAAAAVDEIGDILDELNTNVRHVACVTLFITLLFVIFRSCEWGGKS